MKANVKGIRRKISCWILAVMMTASLFGCSKNDGSDIKTKYSGPISTKQPEASGTVVYDEGAAVIDASNISEGYVMIKCTDSSHTWKVRIVKDVTYTYDLAANGDYDVFPLQMGSGRYSVLIYRNLEDAKYELAASVDLNAAMGDDNTVFVYPNLYIWYTNYAKAVKISYDLCAEAEDDAAKADLIYKYVVSHMTYDTAKAKTVQSGYVPDVDKALASGKGICFDYAAITGAMLRAHDIPTRLVMGNLSIDGADVYHAWNEVYLNGQWVWMDTTFANQEPESSYTPAGDY